MLVFEKIRLTKEEIDIFYGIFKDIDTDGVGMIQMDEFFMYFRLEITDFNGELFRIFDTDGNGQLSFLEFVGVVWNFLTVDPSHIANYVCYIFSGSFEGDKFISTAEIAQMIKLVHGSFAFQNNKSLQTIVRQLEHDSHGMTVDQLIQWVYQHPAVTNPILSVYANLKEKLLGQRFWNRLSKIRSSHPELIPITYILNMYEAAVEVAVLLKEKDEEVLLQNLEETAKNIQAISNGETKSKSAPDSDKSPRPIEGKDELCSRPFARKDKMELVDARIESAGSRPATRGRRGGILDRSRAGLQHKTIFSSLADDGAAAVARKRLQPGAVQEGKKKTGRPACWSCIPVQQKYSDSKPGSPWGTHHSHDSVDSGEVQVAGKKSPDRRRSSVAVAYHKIKTSVIRPKKAKIYSEETTGEDAPKVIRQRIRKVKAPTKPASAVEEAPRRSSLATVLHFVKGIGEGEDDESLARGVTEDQSSEQEVVDGKRRSSIAMAFGKIVKRKTNNRTDKKKKKNNEKQLAKTSTNTNSDS
jgi:Ca2+-binding EF-hand superfamily protein